MKTVGLLAVGLMACGLTVGACAEDNKEPPDKAKLLVGKWEVTKSAEQLPPVGAVYDFSKDGKLKVTFKADGKEKTADAAYQVEGDKLQVTFKVGDKEDKKEPLTIKKLTDSELILEAKGGVTFEYKRVK